MGLIQGALNKDAEWREQWKYLEIFWKKVKNEVMCDDDVTPDSGGGWGGHRGKEG